MNYALICILRVAGLCKVRAGSRRRRTKGWGKTAQTIFTSWAVVEQLGGISLLIAEISQSRPIKANPPMAGDSIGSATSTKRGSFAIGVSSTTGVSQFSSAIGFLAMFRVTTLPHLAITQELVLALQ